MKYCVILLVAAVFWVPSVRTYPGGPPTSTCASMMPPTGAHGYQQTTASPYQLVLNKTTVNSGDTVSLTLSKIQTSTPDFMGFMIEAVDPSNNNIVGKFTNVGTSAQILNCGTSGAGVVGHNGSSNKRFVTVSWTAPNVGTTAKTYHFYYTVVQYQPVFWAKREATTTLVVEPVTTTGAATTTTGAVTTTSTQAATATTPALTTTVQSSTAGASSSAETPDTSLGSTSPQTSMHPDYQGCAETKGCFGSEDNCLSDGSCKIFVAYQLDKSSGKTKMLLHGKDIAQDKYIAMGLSEDGRMGSDLVFWCSNGGSEVTVSWNNGQNNVGGVTGVTPDAQSVTTTDGVTTCSFTIDSKIEAIFSGATKKFDLSTTKYFVLLATGPVSSGSSLSFHSMRVPSGEAIDFQSSALTAGGSSNTWLVQVHGCMMVLAWLAFASSGMLVARYYKKTWKSIKPLQKDFWFRFHQGCMGLAVIATFTAFFVILAERKGEPFDPDLLKSNPHAVIGIICIICAFIQPIMAYFRPHPGTKNRPIFNWAHWFVGNTAFVFAIAAIFLSVELPSTDLDVTLTHAMIAFVIVHAAVNVVLMILRYVNEGKESSSSDPNEDEEGSVVRKVIFAVYFSFVWVFSIAFVVLIVVAKNKTESA